MYDKCERVCICVCTRAYVYIQFCSNYLCVNGPDATSKRTHRGQLELTDGPLSTFGLVENHHLNITVKHRLSIDRPVVVALVLPSKVFSVIQLLRTIEHDFHCLHKTHYGNSDNK